ncbi:hypothetical protein EDC04DRAFT_1246876 [Pisolithus marmoratus]|nr:hypothetical protein EDC04DRAFT_1246876 [Pisolithus marmoratus]
MNYPPRLEGRRAAKTTPLLTSASLVYFILRLSWYSSSPALCPVLPSPPHPHHAIQTPVEDTRPMPSRRVLSGYMLLLSDRTPYSFGNQATNTGPVFYAYRRGSAEHFGVPGSGNETSTHPLLDMFKGIHQHGKNGVDVNLDSTSSSPVI